MAGSVDCPTLGFSGISVHIRSTEESIMMK